MKTSFVNYISTVDFYEIENSIRSSVSDFDACLNYHFADYTATLQKLLSPHADPKPGLSQMETAPQCRERKSHLARIMLSRLSEIGCRHSRTKPSLFSSKTHSLLSPEMAIFSSSRESCLDVDRMLKVFRNVRARPATGFLSSLMRHPQCLLFVNFSVILRLFHSSLNTHLSDPQPALMFLALPNFLRLFFFLQLFGLESLGLGAKFVQSRLTSPQPVHPARAAHPLRPAAPPPDAVAGLQGAQHALGASAHARPAHHFQAAALRLPPAALQNLELVPLPLPTGLLGRPGAPLLPRRPYAPRAGLRAHLLSARAPGPLEPASPLLRLPHRELPGAADLRAADQLLLPHRLAPGLGPVHLESRPQAAARLQVRHARLLRLLPLALPRPSLRVRLRVRVFFRGAPGVGSGPVVRERGAARRVLPGQEDPHPELHPVLPRHQGRVRRAPEYPSPVDCCLPEVLFFEAFCHVPEKLFAQISISGLSLIVFENTFKPKCSDCTQNDFCPILPEVVKEIRLSQIVYVGLGSPHQAPPATPSTSTTRPARPAPPPATSRKR